MRTNTRSPSIFINPPRRRQIVDQWGIADGEFRPSAPPPLRQKKRTELLTNDHKTRQGLDCTMQYDPDDVTMVRSTKAIEKVVNCPHCNEGIVVSYKVIG